ncbi:translation factor Guf1, mitochondrial-like isoform X1 [Acanthaster planci]|uniref:Translation factor GUF1 homolog, mitochondrial n=2 Tax=Acanthaster planci TaxID=133434 RepID=A0A8B7XI70_ACAPL|nr:translation factor Guf1, mitochondrial-like isoform X1 [Acanthaster planci]
MLLLKQYRCQLCRCFKVVRNRCNDSHDSAICTASATPTYPSSVVSSVPVLTATFLRAKINESGRDLQYRRTFCTSVRTAADQKKLGDAVDMSVYPAENIRNFSIIAHVDHGKSTLADRLLELTGTISKKSDNKQVLDRLQVERERGITVKAVTASMFYTHRGKKYLLNLIDTPGHVDFNYEVSRSLKACKGVVLLVDANQGVQAQTVANFYLAFESDLCIIPVLNKIDLKFADPEATANQIKTLFDIEKEDILSISAKLGTGVNEILPAVIDRIPPPQSDLEAPLKALIFDSWYDQYRGAITNIAIIDGKLRKGDRITTAHSGKTYEVQELGIMHPEQVACKELYAGQVGYMIAGMHNLQEARIGDTIYHQNKEVEPLPGFKAAKPMVFAGLYPIDQSEYLALRSAIERLTLNDSSVTLSRDSSPALGQGWRLGFLGLLHMDVFNQRLEQEFNANVIVTVPSVPYKAKMKDTKANRQQYGDNEEITIYNPSLFPERQQVIEYMEPLVLGTVIAPDEHIGKVFSLCLSRRGEQVEYVYIDTKRVLLKYRLPLNEIVVDFFDQLKSVTSGYASFDYEDCGYQAADLVKLSILLNGQEVEELATIVHRDKAREVGKAVCTKLVDTIPRQLYEVAIQAAIGGKIVARENIRALKKNVLAKCYGGDITRKMKLLKRQSEGKKRMKMFGNVEVPKEAFLSILKR